MSTGTEARAAAPGEDPLEGQLWECGKSLEKAVLVPLLACSEENSSGAHTNTARAAQAGDTHTHPAPGVLEHWECVAQLTDDST